ncbi:lipoate--protein ligase [Gemmatimonadetes bacterium T265]|nr:lipoate--protein ligase [Gemmatimonadetes bacterium T265]
MRFVDNRGVLDARRNLALEEYVLRHTPSDEDCLLFYVNAPAIIIGRNQNTIEEINPAVVAERGITVVRRLSGGGAVYHDLGNLNFSFMTPAAPDRFNRYEAFLRPVLDVLRALGLDAELGGRNDVTVGGRKVSGNAQFTTTRRMFSHGTLLVDADLDAVTAALNPKPGKVESKGVKSIRGRVANIAELVAARGGAPGGGPPVTVDSLRDAILERLFGTHDLARVPQVEMTEEDWRAIERLAVEKYGAWAWTYGEDPPSDVRRSRRFAAGELDVRLAVAAGRITTARVYGDFQGPEDVRGFEERLVGVRYDREAVGRALADVDVTAYFGAVSEEEVLDVVVG